MEYAGNQHKLIPGWVIECQDWRLEFDSKYGTQSVAKSLAFDIRQFFLCDIRN